MWDGSIDALGLLGVGILIVAAWSGWARARSERAGRERAEARLAASDAALCSLALSYLDTPHAAPAGEVA